MYVKPVARHCWLSGLRRRPLRLLRASGMAKDAVDVLKRRLRFCFSLSSTLLLYGQIMETSLKSSERFGEQIFNKQKRCQSAQKHTKSGWPCR